MLFVAPFFLVLGCATFYPALAVDNFLGAGVSFPLIKWTGAEALDIFKYDHTIWKACVENGVEESLLWGKKDEMQGCLATILERKDTRAHSEAMNLRDRCGQMLAYQNCMKTGAEDYVKMCDLKDDVKDFLEDTLENNKAMMTTICEDDEAVLYEYLEEDGRKCANNKSRKLRECVSKHATDNMKYDKEGCMRARNFKRCVDHWMSECSTEKARIVTEVIDAGLIATHCKNLTYVHLLRFTKILEYLEEDGRECAKNKYRKLHECVTKHATDNMKYDEEGCMRARNFKRCVDHFMSECSTETARIVTEVIDAGLMATHCKDFDPRMGSSTILSSLLLLTFGVIAAVFAWKF